jgi:hypothetical protein
VSRLSVLIAKPKMALGALLTVALAGAAVAGSGADFTASSANPSNTFAAGTLSIDNSKKDAAILTASNLRPAGPTQTGTVDIQNTGSLSGAFTLTRGTPTDSDGTNPLSGKLNLKIVDCGAWSGGNAPTCDANDAVKYDGTIAEMHTPGHNVAALGTFAADEKHRYEFTVGLDGSAGNEYQGDNSSVAFTWVAA